MRVLCAICERIVVNEGEPESDRTYPKPGNRFLLRLRVRCVRACERAKLHARDDSSVGLANLWGTVVVVSLSTERCSLKIRTVRPLTDDT